MSGLAATGNAAAEDIDWSLFEVVCLANALAAAIMGMDKIAIDKKDERETLLYFADRVRFAAQKSLDLWRNPAEVKRQACAKWPHCV
jgi:hypothetical protein